MITVRRGRLSDVPFIRQLSLDSSLFGIPARRDASNAQVQEAALPYLQEIEQWIYRKQDMAVLVAEAEGQQVGFLVLEFNHVEETTGDRQTFINNLAVDPAWWGKYVVHHLVKAAAKLTGEKGYSYMTARVTASNQRTVTQALRLGFEIERYQIVMACGPEGIREMPGRPPEQQAHRLSREMRKTRAARPKSGE